MTRLVLALILFLAGCEPETDRPIAMGSCDLYTPEDVSENWQRFRESRPPGIYDPMPAIVCIDGRIAFEDSYSGPWFWSTP